MNGVCVCHTCHRLLEDRPDIGLALVLAASPDQHRYYMLHRNERSKGPVPISKMKEWREELKDECDCNN